MSGEGYKTPTDPGINFCVVSSILSIFDPLEVPLQSNLSNDGLVFQLRWSALPSEL